MKIVLDTCVLKLATLPNAHNKAAVIWTLCQAGMLTPFVSPETLSEYHRVLFDNVRFLEEIQTVIRICYPLFTTSVIEHEPDNRFVEVALAVEAQYLITVNTAKGHFDQLQYERTKVVTPGTFLKVPAVAALLNSLEP